MPQDSCNNIRTLERSQCVFNFSTTTENVTMEVINKLDTSKGFEHDGIFHKNFSVL